MLSEIMIKINPKDRINLSNYVRALKAFTTKLLKAGAMPYPTFLQEVNEFSSKWDTKIGKNLRIRYEYRQAKQKGQYVQEWETITMNLLYFVKVRPTSTDPAIISIDILAMTPVLFHEFTHYKQDMKIRSKHFGRYLQALGHDDFKSYFRDPQERQAWAEQYLEFLRTQMKIKKPEEILSQLRKMGLLHDAALNNLKKSDYDSWKAIMRHAIRSAIQELEKEKRKPASKNIP